MTYKVITTFNAGQTGLTLNAQLYDSAGAPYGAAITTGIPELAGGIHQHYFDVDNGFYGTILYYEAGSPTPILAYATIAPPETEAHLRIVENDGTNDLTEDDMLRLQAAVDHADADPGDGTTHTFKSLDGLKDRVVANVTQQGQRTVTTRDGT